MVNIPVLLLKFKIVLSGKRCLLNEMDELVDFIFELFQLESETKIYDTSDVKGAEPSKGTDISLMK